MRYLINHDGKPFNSSELKTLTQQLDQLEEVDRIKYRDQNAAAISRNNSKKILIISGPGTGKSYLFLDRINHWFQNNPEARVLVTSFVRKLVADLRNSINNDKELSEEQKKRTTVSTLHKFARSVVEKNHGTSEWKFKPYFRIIGQTWKEVVWGDVLTYYPKFDRNVYAWQEFEEQLYNNSLDEEEDWQKLTRTYFELCRFYNAAGFADLIIRARIALEENPQLNDDDFFIVDEYQDFNLAEEALILQLVKGSKGLLVVGDDDQVLYEKLKSGKAELIRRFYKNVDIANAMLPFCTRSSYHITKCGAYFIAHYGDSDRIEKIHLPLYINQDAPRVQIIACATPSTAVDYIEKFVADNKNEIDERKERLLTGEAEDAYLLILTPAREVNFYGRSKTKIKQIVSDYKAASQSFSEDYYKVLNYYLLAKNPNNNFTFRKILFYEDFTEKQIHPWITEATRDNKSFCSLDYEEIKKILEKCDNIKNIIDAKECIDEKIDNLSTHMQIIDRSALKEDLEQQAINQDEITKLERGEEEEAELEESEVKKMSPVELITIVGSKGLSADHVMIIGFDNVNMNWVTKNAFYVAMMRARKTLHILTALKSGGSTKAHRFLQQLPKTCVEFHSYKKSDHSKTLLNGRRGFINYVERLNSVSKRRRKK